ncbi:LacI family transcriptional regulator [Tepidanaerobacter syntrophicus]|uniref:LacI family DNA-binding transcriptional regulator n=1 Tax=Tepidanaerobacter syntrophicus TaxID=224999 RepID=UPI0022EE3A3D|nr:LacI family DNA-binding transcriptional regulator [Tepidanaerobacter syntrophicus]GLI20234.1 LacI family transcriptional regulator [Tepidanaerobacter syntrophicus]
MATLKDVAKLACVDVSTVSRALNNTSYVHPDTKARIMAAVKELSYAPNVLAQGLRQGKRHTIGVVIPRLYFTIFAEIVQGIEEEARKRGYATLICNTEDDPKIEKENLNKLRNGFIDGIIIAGTGHNNRILKDILANGLAVTQIIRKQEDTMSSVTVDYAKCGYDAVIYLAKKGCREIGLINGPMNLAPYRERYQGYHKAMTKLALRETTTSIDAQSNSLEYGYHCTFEFLKQNPNLDAIIAAVDTQGIGVLRALKECRIQVPEKMHVMSLTGYTIGSMLETSMTALEMPAREIGIQAANITIEYIEAPSEKKPSVRHLVFNSILAERESG